MRLYPERQRRNSRHLRSQHPDELTWSRLSRDFGTPHPTIAHSYGQELLNVPPLPAFSGYSSRLLAESWDSGNLYWARLADEAGQSPEALNRLVPELTGRMIEKILPPASKTGRLSCAPCVRPVRISKRVDSPSSP